MKIILLTSLILVFLISGCYSEQTSVSQQESISKINKENELLQVKLNEVYQLKYEKSKKIEVYIDVGFKANKQLKTINENLGNPAVWRAYLYLGPGDVILVPSCGHSADIGDFNNIFKEEFDIEYCFDKSDKKYINFLGKSVKLILDWVAYDTGDIGYHSKIQERKLSLDNILKERKYIHVLDLKPIK